jgi:hypothetical protein
MGRLTLFLFLGYLYKKKMSEIIINEKQLELIQDLITKEDNLKLAEQNWKKFSKKEKLMVVEICKELYPKKAKLIKENKWYNTLGDIAGVFDPTGVVDLVNGISYINQGDNLFGFLSLVSAVPYAGDIVAKPVMGALKIGSPSAKALEGVLKLSKEGKSVEAASELAKISATGGLIGKFVDGVAKIGGKLKGLVQRIPLPGGLKRTLTQWLELFEKGVVKGKTVRYGSGMFAKNIPKLSKAEQIAGLEKLIKASKESGLFTSYRTSTGLLSWKTIFGGMPQLIGRNKSVRALVRQTKFWAGFLDFLGVGNFVGPDEVLAKMGQEGLESKMAEYQKTSQGQEYFKESFGQGQQQTQQPTQQTSSTPTSTSNPIGDFFKSVFSKEALAAAL